MTARPASSGAAGPDSAGSGAPRHVALIMDGNGRWAKARRLPRVAGHKAGADSVRSVVEGAPELGIDVLTLYAFSSENWKRPQDEVGYLFGLLKQYLLSEIAELDANEVELRFIGDWERLPGELVTLLRGALDRTAGNKGLKLVIALNYGSQDEILRAARRIAVDAAAGKIDPDAIDEAVFEAHLDTAGLPPPDLIVRTSGEMRLSNFLMWQAAYAEFVFTPTLWPDFDKHALAEACAAFRARDRRYGGL